MDDCYKNLKVNNRKKTFRIRVITFNTGKVWDSYKKRYKLQNKRFSYILCEEGNFIYKKDLIKFIKDKINLFYEFNKFPKLIINGDGATWIKMTANELKGIYIHDKWHVHKLLWKIFLQRVNKSDDKYQNKNKKNFLMYAEAKNYVNSGNYQELIKLLINNNIDDEIIKYFQKNRIGIENQNLNLNIGSSTESDVFHFIKSTCSGARIFSLNHFINMLQLKALNYNNKIEI